MRHRHLVAEVESARHAGFVILAQHLAQRGGAVAEDRQVFADSLLEQAQHQALGQRDRHPTRQRTGGQRGFQAAGRGDCLCAPGDGVQLLQSCGARAAYVKWFVHAGTRSVVCSLARLARKASSTRSGVAGSDVMRTPTAS